MRSIGFHEANCTFNPPHGYDESQVRSILAYRGPANGGSMDGSELVVVAWKPSAEELAWINLGHPIFLTMVGGLSPHFLSTNFHAATHPA